MRKLSFKVFGYFSILAMLSGANVMAAAEHADGQGSTLADRPVTTGKAGYDGWMTKASNWSALGINQAKSAAWEGNIIKVYPTSPAFKEMFEIGKRLAWFSKELGATCGESNSAGQFAKVLDLCFAEGGIYSGFADSQKVSDRYELRMNGAEMYACRTEIKKYNDWLRKKVGKDQTSWELETKANRMFDLTWNATSPKLPQTDSEKKFVATLAAQNQAVKAAMDKESGDVCKTPITLAQGGPTLAGGAGDGGAMAGGAWETVACYAAPIRKPFQPIRNLIRRIRCRRGHCAQVCVTKGWYPCPGKACDNVGTYSASPKQYSQPGYEPKAGHYPGNDYTPNNYHPGVQPYQGNGIGNYPHMPYDQGQGNYPAPAPYGAVGGSIPPGAAPAPFIGGGGGGGGFPISGYGFGGGGGYPPPFLPPAVGGPVPLPLPPPPVPLPATLAVEITLPRATPVVTPLTFGNLCLPGLMGPQVTPYGGGQMGGNPLNPLARTVGGIGSPMLGGMGSPMMGGMNGMSSMTAGTNPLARINPLCLPRLPQPMPMPMPMPIVRPGVPQFPGGPVVTPTQPPIVTPTNPNPNNPNPQNPNAPVTNTGNIGRDGGSIPRGVVGAKL